MSVFQHPVRPSSCSFTFSWTWKRLSPFGPFRVSVPDAASRASIVPVKNFTWGFGAVFFSVPAIAFLAGWGWGGDFSLAHPPATNERANAAAASTRNSFLIFTLDRRLKKRAGGLCPPARASRKPLWG